MSMMEEVKEIKTCGNSNGKRWVKVFIYLLIREERRSLLLAPGENSQESMKENIPLKFSEGSLKVTIGE